MKKLILGTSGAGKTYLSKYFSNKGLNAFDADEIEDLHGWYNWKKEKVKFPYDAGKEFMDNHEFLWNRQVLENFLKNHQDIYFFGNSGNALKMVDLFDQVFYLDVPDGIRLERLNHQTRKNPMGKTQEQKKEILDWDKFNKREAVNVGAVLIDSTLTPEEILKLIA